MTYFNVKFKDVVAMTDKAICLEQWCNKGNVWLPLKCVRENTKYTKGIAYLVPEWLCNEKGLGGKEYQPYHHPEKIAPQYNQEAIDELKL